MQVTLPAIPSWKRPGHSAQVYKQEGDIAMKNVTLGQATKFTSPNPVSIVCTQKKDGSTNLATVSWWTCLSQYPSMIGFAMAKTSFSGDRIRETRKVILTIPGASLADIALGCGRTTGRDTDKIIKFGVEMETVDGSPIQIPAHSRVAIVCTMKEYHEAGDHYFYICDVDQVYADPREEALFAWGGYNKLAPAHQ